MTFRKHPYVLNLYGWRKRQMNTFKVQKRDMETKAKKLRREGYVTGNLFGKEIEGSVLLKIERKEAERMQRECMKGSQVMLDLDGQSYDVLIKEMDYDPAKNMLMEIDFQALVSNEKVHSVAEVVLLNHEKVLDGILQQKLEEISYKALHPSGLILYIAPFILVAFATAYSYAAYALLKRYAPRLLNLLTGARSK